MMYLLHYSNIQYYIKACIAGFFFFAKYAEIILIKINFFLLENLKYSLKEQNIKHTTCFCEVLSSGANIVICN